MFPLTRSRLTHRRQRPLHPPTRIGGSRKSAPSVPATVPPAVANAIAPKMLVVAAPHAIGTREPMVVSVTSTIIPARSAEARSTSLPVARPPCRRLATSTPSIRRMA